MSRRREILYHIIFWFFFIGLDQLLSRITMRKDLDSAWSIMQGVGFATLQLLIFYINYLWICPLTIPRKKWVFFIAGQLVLIVLFPSLRFLFEEVLLYSITGIHNYNLSDLNIIYYLYDNSFYVIRILLFSIVGYFLKYLWNTSAQVSQLTIEKKQAELQALKSQLSPHFLFNSLNGFYSDMYSTNPEVAADILKLSEMLRYVTYESGNDMVLLKDEIMFLQNYIDLFKRRYDGNVPVTFTKPTDFGDYKVPSLLLIHFLENAFKHGVIDDYEYPVTIHLKVESGRLIFTVGNKYRTMKSYDEHGIGHKNISQRLALMYPNNHTLTITKDPDYYNIILAIPLNK
jgi:two-component system LytT family sensor kinase